MENYSTEFKDEMVKKLLMPSGPSIDKLAKATGVGKSTLWKWKRKKLEGEKMDSKSGNKEWSAEQKLEAVTATSQLSGAELGEYLRKAGLHSAEVERWRQAALAAIAEHGRGRPKLPAEVVELKKRNEQLEKDLCRKDKALAEVSALLVLKKKAELLWGVEEEDE